METQNKNLQSYDIKFSVMHLKQLLFNTNDINEMQPVYNYIKKFFSDIKLTFFSLIVKNMNYTKEKKQWN